jgi:hypothetical protein
MNATDLHDRAEPGRRRVRVNDHLAKARNLVCLANRKGLHVDQDVVGVVVQADRACAERGQIDFDLETRFWRAYATLRQTIPSAARARTWYRTVFYLALAVMLLFQCYFLFGSRVHDEVGRLRTEQTELLGEKAKGAGPADEARIARAVTQNQLAQTAYRELALRLVPYGQLIASGNSDAKSDSGFEVAFAALKMILDFLAAYLLPALYGLLGACAFVLRQLCAELSTKAGARRFVNDSRIRYSLRLNIGVLAGLAVGWFIDPTQEGSVVANLSPLALAFVAGYGSDLLFAVLDRIVNALAGPLTAETVAPAKEAPAEPISEHQSEAAEPRPAAVPPGSKGSGSDGKASRRGKRAGTNGVHSLAAPAS